MRLFVVRHGETEENRKGILQGHLPGQLTAKGKAQARLIGGRLKSVPLKVIYCSDSARARDTAKEIIKHHPGIHIIFTKDLRERFFGRHEGRFHKDIDWDSARRNFETVAHFRQRILKVLKTASAAHPDDEVLFVTHGGSIVALFAILEKKKANFLQALPPTALSIIQIKEGKSLKILLKNDARHLQDR
ncbi:MAG: histidine phosphatase family protein [Nanoarchaeota archaeon]